MPRSKRNKVVALTKVKKKTKENKTELIDVIRERAESYPYILLVRLENQKNAWLKEIRQQIPNTILTCGKNKLVQKALGTNVASECVKGIHHLSEKLVGFNALMFTKRPPHAVVQALEEFHPTDYARCGLVATETVTLQRGFETCAHLAHSTESHLRALGMPTRLQMGKIEMMGEYQAAVEGKPLTQDQAQVLKLMKHPMAVFSCDVLGIFYSKEGQYFPYQKSDKSIQEVVERDTKLCSEMTGAVDTTEDVTMEGA